jgi:hypothetical protein
MSYDLQVWSVNPASFSQHFPDSTDWKSDNDFWLYQRRSWKISICRSVRALPEDLPFEVSRALPGIGYLTELNLAPINASEPARKFVLRTAIAIAKAAYGVVFDPQDNTLTLPSGVRRFVKPPSDESASIINFSWWFVDGPIAVDNNYGALLDVLEGELPETLPRRYGLFEPPQHVYADEGREHFLKFLADHAKGVGMIWYPSAPVVGVYLSLPVPIGASKRGFRSARLSIEVDLNALKQPGWQVTLRRLWRSVSAAIQPFYGDVRTLHGYRRSRGRLWVARDTMRHPVKAWWWPGVPPGPAHAIVLDSRYSELWPAFCDSAVMASGLFFVDTDDWNVDANVYERVGQAPLEIIGRDPTSAIPQEYPIGWPFGLPRCES